MALASWAVGIPLPGVHFPPSLLLLLLDPRWAIPIKARVREASQARAINEVINAASSSTFSGATTTLYGNGYDILSMGLCERRKEDLRARWCQNETDCLREKRQKVDVSAFVKLRTVEVSGDYCPNCLSEVPSANVCAEKTLLGHSIVRGHPSCRMLRAFGVVSLVRERTTGKLFAMKQVRVFLPERCFTLSAVFVCPVSQDGYAADSEGPGGPRSRRV